MAYYMGEVHLFNGFNVNHECIIVKHRLGVLKFQYKNPELAITC